MGYRSFLDPKNRRWEVWLVMPTASERRKEERRVASGSSPAAYAGIERRTTPSRRKAHFRAVLWFRPATKMDGSVSKTAKGKNVGWHRSPMCGNTEAISSFGFGVGARFVS